MWRLLEEAGDVVEITVPHARQPRLSGVLVHRSLDLVPAATTIRRSITVTNPLRTLVDLGAVLPGNLLEDALDRALVRRLVSLRAVEAALQQVARPGRNGVGVLRRVLDDRALGDAPPDGLLEPRMARLLRAAELPPAVFQHTVRDAGRFVGRVDFAYPDLRFAIEVDGYGSHATPEALQHDLDRGNALADAGWELRRFTWVDVVRRPWKVADGIGRALCARSTP
jgi:very-short-patch-repair endonuclease